MRTVFTGLRFSGVAALERTPGLTHLRVACLGTLWETYLTSFTKILSAPREKKRTLEKCASDVSVRLGVTAMQTSLGLYLFICPIFMADVAVKLRKKGA